MSPAAPGEGPPGDGHRSGGDARSGGDVGLATERTTLAWRRTVIAALAVAVLITRATLTGGPAGSPLLGAGALLGWVGLVLVAYRRTRALPTARTGSAAPAALVTAMITIGFGVLGVTAVLVCLG